MQSNPAAGGFMQAATKPASYRWMQLFMGIVCMAMIANLQYGWTL
ncbi:MAG: oxlT, partial [Betaproteobacteria bacterium]|nr:oxlT [Betaproteobacteria bacterium]